MNFGIWYKTVVPSSRPATKTCETAWRSHLHSVQSAVEQQDTDGSPLRTPQWSLPPGFVLTDAAPTLHRRPDRFLVGIPTDRWCRVAPTTIPTFTHGVAYLGLTGTPVSNDGRSGLSASARESRPMPPYRPGPNLSGRSGDGNAPR